MYKVVLDCSTTIAYFFKDETSNYVDAALEMLAEKGRALVPPIWPLEVVNTFLSAERRKRLSKAETEKIFLILETLPIELTQYPNLQTVRDVQAIARKHTLSAYDASYLELAQRENAPLITLDKKLKQAAVKADIALWTPA